MHKGQCDCCGRSDVSLSHTVAYGIETYACALCFGYPADEFDEEAEEATTGDVSADRGDTRVDPLASRI